jgi:soluble lytic murein transglycosylase
MRITASRSKPMFLLAAACVVAFAVACDRSLDDTDVIVPRATVTVAPPATPTPPPADFSLGEELQHEGAFEAAIDVYAAVVREGDAAERQEARLAQARLLKRIERYDDAHGVLADYVAEAHDVVDGTTAQFLLASTLDDLGRSEQALAHYAAYADAGGEAAAYARIEQAKVLARAGRPAEADAAAEEVLASGVLSSVAASFTLSMGTAHEEGGSPDRALAWFGRAEAGNPATALLRSGMLRREQGDPAWTDDLAEVVRDYPSTGAARTALDLLDEGGVGVSDYHRGVVLYRAFRNDEARAAMERAIAQGERPADAAYYLAILDEREGDFPSAISNYAAVTALDPGSQHAPDALWWLGRLLEADQRYDEARDAYTRLAAGYPNSVWAPDADFRSALGTFRAGRHADAAAHWGALSARSEGQEQLRARFWEAKALAAAGDPRGEDLLHQLAAEEPDDFYGLRAAVLAGINDDDLGDPDTSEREPDWQAIGESIDATQPPPLSPVLTPVGGDHPAWGNARELAEVGLVPQANAVYLSIVADNEGDVRGLLHVVRRLHDEGLPGLAARAATRLIATLPDDAEPHEELLKLAYPLAYGDLAVESAEREGVSPLLLLALVRQESFYDPDAGSVAGALGLTQVIPSTGEGIAERLGVPDFSTTDLFRPRLSLEFGASYLALRLADFEGNAYLALAAYNGGAGTAMNAARTAGDDMDLFVEDLEFEETQLYVKLVMENYARYRHLYEGIDAPSLPR